MVKVNVALRAERLRELARTGAEATLRELPAEIIAIEPSLNWLSRDADGSSRLAEASDSSHP